MTPGQMEDLLGDIRSIIRREFKERDEKAEADEKKGSKKILEALEANTAALDAMRKAFDELPEEEEKEEEDFFARLEKWASSPAIAPHAAKIYARVSEPGAIDSFLERMFGSTVKATARVE